MQYQVIILAFRYLLASFGRGAAARSRWFWTELVPQGRAPQAAAARQAIFRRSNRKGGQNHVSWRGAPPAEAHIDLRSADRRPSTAAGPA